MKALAMVASAAAFVWLIGAAVACAIGALEHDATKRQLWWATVLWFVATPCWMGRSSGPPAAATNGPAQPGGRRSL